MIKYAIKFADGSYWRNFTQTTTVVKEAWSFNKEDRAKEHGLGIGLKDFTVVPLKLTFPEQGGGSIVEEITNG